MKKISAIGNALVDVITQIDSDKLLEELNLPKGSMQLVDLELSNQIKEKTSHLQSKLVTGGSAGNTIRSLAMLGAKTGFFGKIAEDEFGNFFKKDMETSGVEANLLVSKTPSGRAVALVSKDSERTFATYLGAASEMNANEINTDKFADYNYMHVEGYLVFNHALIERVLIEAKDKNLIVSMDMASYNVVEANLDFLKDMIKKYVDIVFANEEEAKALTGEEPQKALNIIADWCDIAVVKVGADGSFIKKDGLITKVDAIKAKPVDTTGAGDNFASGFLYGLSNNWPIEKCGMAGSLLAGKVIEVYGTTMSENTWKYIFENIKIIENID